MQFKFYQFNFINNGKMSFIDFLEKLFYKKQIYVNSVSIFLGVTS